MARTIHDLMHKEFHKLTLHARPWDLSGAFAAKYPTFTELRGKYTDRSP